MILRDLILDQLLIDLKNYKIRFFYMKIFILINCPRNGSIIFQTISNELFESKNIAAINASNTSAKIFGADKCIALSLEEMFLLLI